MPIKKKRMVPFQSKIRDIAWEVGQTYPPACSSDYITLLLVAPGQGHVHWHLRDRSISVVVRKKKIARSHVQRVIRIHDVTDVIYDGTNSHNHFDLTVYNNEGHYSFGHIHGGRYYLAEFGLVSKGAFHVIARSEALFFDHDRPSGSYSTAGLFKGGMIQRTFPVDNMFDAPVYEKMNRELASIKREAPLSVAVVVIGNCTELPERNIAGTSIQKLRQGFEKLGVKTAFFYEHEKDRFTDPDQFFVNFSAVSERVCKEIAAAHRKKPFHLIHCHDWYSAGAAIIGKKKLQIPLVLSLHCPAYQRAQSDVKSGVSKKIRTAEKRAVKTADLVIAPRSSIRQHIIELYNADPEKIVVISDITADNTSDLSHVSSEARQWFNIPEESRVVLFSGEMSHAAGADLMLDALPTVCRNHRESHFIFAGEGPLKGELEARAHHMGVSHRCRFTGHLSRKAFETVLAAADFVVIPARSWQDEGFARMARDFGKPVLATHQSGVNSIEHGKNGLLTFDNPGSIVWGIQELLHNPLHESMMRAAARKSAGNACSVESVIAQQYMYYEIILKKQGGGKHG